jgi:hypothetical protein
VGGTPGAVKVTANKAKNCRSYHFSLTAPQDNHISGIFLVDGGGRPVKKAKWSPYNLGGAYFRTTGHGLQTGHFYSRDLVRETKEKHLILDLRISETPPGATGRAFLASTMIMFLIVLVSTVSQPNIGGFQIDLAAIVLATVPTAVATMAFVSHFGSAQDGVKPLPAILSGAVTTACAILAVGFLVLHGARGDLRLRLERLSVFNELNEFDMLGVPEGAWSVLFFIAIFNALIIGGTTIVRRIRHQKLLSRHIDLDNEGVVMGD